MSASMPGRSRVTISGRAVRLSNLDKVLYPEAEFTKGQVIDYYRRIAPFMLPHLKDRPLSLKRYPEGVHQSSFFQKNCPSHRPEWVSTMRVQTEKGRSGRTVIEFCVVRDEAGLIWLANLAALELHTYLCTTSDFDTPTMMVFDLDPGPGTDLRDCLRVGLQLRDALAHFKLASFAKTSGGKGLHLAVPLNSSASFDRTKRFARAIANVLQRMDPTRITTTMSKKERKNRVFIDWAQNDRHKTTVCVYSLRAQPRPMVSMPISWERIRRAHRNGRADSLMTDTDEAVRLAHRHGDLFAEVLTRRQRLPRPADVRQTAKST